MGYRMGARRLGFLFSEIYTRKRHLDNDLSLIGCTDLGREGNFYRNYIDVY